MRLGFSPVPSADVTVTNLHPPSVTQHIVNGGCTCGCPACVQSHGGRCICADCTCQSYDKCRGEDGTCVLCRPKSPKENTA